MLLELDNCTAAYIYHMAKSRLSWVERRIEHNQHFLDSFGQAIPRFELDNMRLEGERYKLTLLIQRLELAFVESWNDAELRSSIIRCKEQFIEQLAYFRAALLL